MDRITRLALMGYVDAQAEMCARGKLLPCPKCFKDSAKIIGDVEDFQYPITIDELQSTKNTRIAVACTECGIVSTTYELGEDKKDTLIKLVVDWNTRSAPSLGRCVDCANWDKEHRAGRESLGNYVCVCHEWSDEEDGHFRSTPPDGFCNNFEPKEEPNNEE